MNRRSVLITGAAVATLSLAGCSGGGESAGESTPAPRIDSSAERLVFSLDDFDEARWSKVDEEIEHNMAQRRVVSREEASRRFIQRSGNAKLHLELNANTTN